jgi:1,2-phenylacetyl-CoA epoxidase catalytic subunit
MVRPDHEHLRTAGLGAERAYRLKARDNDEVRHAFSEEVRRLAAAAGLSLPEWQPAWERLPEEAQIPG